MNDRSAGRVWIVLALTSLMVLQIISSLPFNLADEEEFDGGVELTAPQMVALANLNGESENLTGGLDWVSTAGGSGGPDFIYDVATDGSGNVIIAGSVSYNVTLGNLQISSTGGSTAFVAKLNAFGYWTWAASLNSVNSGGTSVVSAIDIDSNGMIYLAGDMYDRHSAGAYSVGSNDEYGIFVAKLNPQGAWVWVEDVVNDGYSVVRGVSVDSYGNVGIVGSFSGDLYFPTPYALSTDWDTDVFVAKLNSGGNYWHWVESFGGDSNDYGSDIDLWDIYSGNEGNCSSNQNNFVITGSFSNNIVFGDQNYSTNRWNSSAFVTWLCGDDGSVYQSLAEGMPDQNSYTIQEWYSFNSWSRNSGWYSGYNAQDGYANGYSSSYLYSHTGNYPSSMSSTTYATSPTVNGIGYSSSNAYFLEFDRMLGIESSVYDEANIQVYKNGYWYTIWSNPSYTIDESGNNGSSWTKVTYDVSNYFPGNSQFKVRFGIGPSDSIVEYTGWAIDNVRITQGERYVAGESAGYSITHRDGSSQFAGSCVALGGVGSGNLKFSSPTSSGVANYNTGGYDSNVWVIPVCAYEDPSGFSGSWIPWSDSSLKVSTAGFISDISIDANDKVVVSGNYYDDVWFGSNYLSDYDDSDIFIATIENFFSNDTSWDDAYRGGGYGEDRVQAHAVTSTGSVIIGGSIDGSPQFGNTYLSAYSDVDGLVAQMSSSGTWAWAKQIGGAGGVDYSMATEGLSNGKVAIGGSFQGVADFGDMNVTSNGDFDGFIAIYNNDGTIDKVQSYGYEGEQRIIQLQQEESGALYAVGTMECISNNVYIFGKWVSCPNSSGEGNGLFIAKLDLDLNADWVTGVGLGYGDGEIISFAELSDGSLAICGTHSEGDIEIGSFEEENSLEGVQQLICSKLSSTTGNAQWLSRVDMSDRYEEMWVRGLVVDSQDNIVMTGNFVGTASFGSISTIASAGNEDTGDLFVASIDDSGDWNWAIAGGGQNGDSGSAILIDSDGKYRLYGSMTGSAAIGSTMLTGSDSSATYPITATITTNGAWSSAKYFDHSGNSGLAITAESLTEDLQIVWFVYNSQLTLDNSMLLGPNNGDFNNLGIGMYNSSLDRWVGTEEIVDLEESGVEGFAMSLDSSKEGYITMSGYYDGGTNPFPGYDVITDGSYNAFVLSYELDTDLDGLLNSEDYCEYGATGWVSDYTTDHDSDGCKDSDIEDLDDDNDGVQDPVDEANPVWGEDHCFRGALGWVSDSSSDYDSDGCQDSGVEDLDDDNDGVVDPVDLSNPMAGEDFCHKGDLNWTSDTSTDWDMDGCRDDSSEDTDDDNDGVVDPADVQSPMNGEDHCYRGSLGWVSDSSTDYDGDGCQDSGEDIDDDNDGVDDDSDLCQMGSLSWSSDATNDYDGDGCEDSTEDDDDDNDSVLDIDDSCVRGNLGWVSDTSTTDHDGDGCQDDSGEDADDDNDGIEDSLDMCPKGDLGWISVSTVTDYDNDGCRDDSSEDIDDDNDGVVDPANVQSPEEGEDYCYRGNLGWLSDTSNDYDEDGCRDDGEDNDDDNDGVEDSLDMCPAGDLGWTSITAMNDYDSDGCQDDSSEDADDDNDGVVDPVDVQSPIDGEDYCYRGLLNWVSSSSTDYDGDGCKDDSAEDNDDDNDGLIDIQDSCVKSLGANEGWLSLEGEDYDGDGCRDADEDNDDDGDGVLDREDGCALGEKDWISSTSNDADGDGCKDDVEDLDDDGDGTEDAQQFMLSGEGAGYTWTIIGSLIGALVAILLVYRFAKGGSSGVSNQMYREIENEVRQEIEFERVEESMTATNDLDVAMREFPQWSRNEIQDYFDQGWTIESLKEWLNNK